MMSKTKLPKSVSYEIHVKIDKSTSIYPTDVTEIIHALIEVGTIQNNKPEIVNAVLTILDLVIKRDDRQ